MHTCMRACVHARLLALILVMRACVHGSGRGVYTLRNMHVAAQVVVVVVVGMLLDLYWQCMRLVLEAGHY